jgi:hypothetical protein
MMMMVMMMMMLCCYCVPAEEFVSPNLCLVSGRSAQRRSITARTRRRSKKTKARLFLLIFHECDAKKGLEIFRKGLEASDVLWVSKV